MRLKTHMLDVLERYHSYVLGAKSNLNKVLFTLKLGS